MGPTLVTVIDMLPVAVYGILFLASVGGLGLAATVTLLKAKYVLFVLGLVVIVIGVQYATAEVPAVFGVGVLVWAVAASRLGWPHSVWARWTYDERRMALARVRFPAPTPTGAEPGGEVETPVATAHPVCPVRPDRPALVGRGFWLLVAGMIVGSLALSTWALLAGVLLPFAVLVRAGWATARTVCTVVFGLGIVIEAVRLPGRPLVAVLVVVFATVLVGAGILLFHRPVVTAYLRGSSA